MPTGVDCGGGEPACCREGWTVAGQHRGSPRSCANDVSSLNCPLGLNLMTRGMPPTNTPRHGSHFSQVTKSALCSRPGGRITTDMECMQSRSSELAPSATGRKQLMAGAGAHHPPHSLLPRARHLPARVCARQNIPSFFPHATPPVFRRHDSCHRRTLRCRFTW